MTPGTLYLVPATLGECRLEAVLPAEVCEIARSLDYFIVENAKSARSELKRLGFPRPLRDIDIRELPREPTLAELDALLVPLIAGRSAGLMSEAGVPAVADPGARLVQAAHEAKIRVAPLVGPSSILLALMASGLNGQSFAFHGYLPIREPERSKRIAELESESLLDQRTQIFIETPYRNAALFSALLQACRPATRLCIASGLTTDRERIESRRIDIWRSLPTPAIEKKPSVFMLLAE